MLISQENIKLLECIGQGRKVLNCMVTPVGKLVQIWFLLWLVWKSTNDLAGLLVSWCCHMQHWGIFYYQVHINYLANCLSMGLGISISWPTLPVDNAVRICIVIVLLLSSPYLSTHRRVWHCVQGSTGWDGNSTFPKSCGSENVERLAYLPGSWKNSCNGRMLISDKPSNRVLSRSLNPAHLRPGDHNCFYFVCFLIFYFLFFVCLFVLFVCLFVCLFFDQLIAWSIDWLSDG